MSPAIAFMTAYFVVTSLILAFFFFCVLSCKGDKLLDRIFKIFVIFAANLYLTNYFAGMFTIFFFLSQGIDKPSDRETMLAVAVWQSIFVLGWTVFFGVRFLKSRKKSKTR